MTDQVFEATARRRVMIVVSSYAPAMIADMHRARHLAWELKEIGWDVEILAPSLGYQVQSTADPDSGPFFPSPNAVTYVAPFLPRLFARLGVRTIGWRALVPMFFAGGRILRQGVDIVYFSTTQFSLFLLGPLWRLRFATPYVLDIHDPCVRDDGAWPTWMSFNLKHSISRWLLKRIEAVTTRRATGVVAVSRHYIDALLRRYRDRNPVWAQPNKNAVIPFAALDLDLREAATCREPRGHGDVTRIVYVGAGGPIMARSFDLLCRALAAIGDRDPGRLSHTRIELYGTVFRWEEGGGRRDLAEIAADSGLGGVIDERPARVSYRRSLQLLLGADGALVLGVDDPGYMPSKLISYALSGKPLLSVLRRDGAAYQMLKANPGLGKVIWFDGPDEIPLDEAAQIVGQFLGECARRQNFDRTALLEPYLAPAMARRHARLFDACLADH